MSFSRSIALLSLALAAGCAIHRPPPANELHCAPDLSEVLEKREPNFVDHLCEDADGLAQGIAWTTQDGEVRGLGEFVDGEPHGEMTIWTETGSLWAKAEHDNGNPVRFQTWHDSGERWSDIQYTGPDSSEIREWDESGNLSDHLFYRDGEIEGTWTKYWPDGSVKSQAEYRAGKLHGHFVAWHENGQRRVRGQFQGDSKVGEWRYWNEDGTVASEPLPSATCSQ